MRFKVAEIEAAVAVAGDGEQLWIKCGEITLGVDAQIRARQRDNRLAR